MINIIITKTRFCILRKEQTPLKDMGQHQNTLTLMILTTLNIHFNVFDIVCKIV